MPHAGDEAPRVAAACADEAEAGRREQVSQPRSVDRRGFAVLQQHGVGLLCLQAGANPFRTGLAEQAGGCHLRR